MNTSIPSFCAAAGILFAINGLCSSTCLGYGHEGHQIVGAIADKLLEGTPAAQHVHDLLGDDTLSQTATWADDVKSGAFDDESEEFIDHNAGHHHYHYTDVPFEETAYADRKAGTNPEDIVHIMRQCIQVLNFHDTRRTNPHGFTPRLALILLSHYIGDIHQPLHVGAAYLNDDDEFVDPNVDGHAPNFGIGDTIAEDHGGNFLKFGGSLLHAYWDDNAVRTAMHKIHAQSVEAFATHCKEHPPEHWETGGSVEELPKKWATEILPLAARAHQGFQIGARHTVHDHFGTHLQWDIAQPTQEADRDYRAFARDTVFDELNKAGYRLAALLQKIWPQ